MRDVRALAAAYGVRVETADLGDWGSATLLAEYDPDGPVIRLNQRASWRTLRQAQGDMAASLNVSVTLSSSKGAPPCHAFAATPDHAITHTPDHAMTPEHAIAHELYHHREAIGEVPRIADRAARERAADAYAEDLLRASEPAR